MPSHHPTLFRPTRTWLALSLASCALSSLAALPAPDPDNGGLTLPPGFRALIVADDLIAGRKVGNDSDQLRFIAAAPNGDLYAKTLRGGIIALRDTDGDGRFDLRREFGDGGGTGIALRGDWLYHSTNTAVLRYPYRNDELVPGGAPQPIVVDLPDRRSHSAKCFAFDAEGRLLVEIGSPYNVYSEPDRQLGAKGKDATEFLQSFGGFWRFDANRPGQTQADGFHFSTGHRHCLSIAWQPVAREFFMVMMGRDNMNTVAPEFYDALDNAERVAEEMHRLHEGANLGWPYTYWDPIKKARMVAPEFGGDNRRRTEPGRYAEPLIAFPAHWAPLQMTFHTGAQFPDRYHGGAFIAFHGSWNRAPLPQDGYNVCFVPFDRQGAPLGTYEVFAANAGPQRFRMGGVAVAPDGSLFISETDRGRIWRILYTGTTPAPAVAAPSTRPTPPAEPAPIVNSDHPGRRLYTRYCAACHMADGAGAGQLNPALVANAVVSGDKTRLIDVILRGPAAALPADRPKFANFMPPFPKLKDREVADLLTYLRQTYGGTTPVTLAEVAAVRASK
ncbi:MAG: c-type cytochrome [Opitutaceae bacterium]|nr:c-type cytochrome [Opitutaceae bacterium]